MFREPHQFVQRVVDDEQALAVEDNPHIAAAGAGYFLLCKTAALDASGHVVRLEEQAAAGKVARKESMAFVRGAEYVTERNVTLCCGGDTSRPAQVPRCFPPFKPALALCIAVDCRSPASSLVQAVARSRTNIALSFSR